MKRERGRWEEERGKVRGRKRNAIHHKITAKTNHDERNEMSARGQQPTRESAKQTEKKDEKQHGKCSRVGTA